MNVKIKLTKEGAKFPEYAHGPEEDAGMDLFAVDRVTIPPGQAKLVPTGIMIELPPGHEAQIRPRSGLALKNSVTVNFGTVDPGYRGEIGVIAFNLSHLRGDYVVEKGDKIAQLVISKYEKVEWKEVDDFVESNRGAKGFGSSGK